MSKLFFDHILELDELEAHLRDIAETEEERHELWHIIDDIIHHEVLDCIFDHLPHEHHEEFLEKYHSAPYDESLIIFTDERIEGDMNTLINERINSIGQEILQEALEE